MTFVNELDFESPIMFTPEGQVLRLTPRQNQDFRLLLRVCQRSLVAIGGYGCPLISGLVPFYTTSPALFGSLLALAGQVRARLQREQYLGAQPDTREDHEGTPPLDDAYHQTLINVRALVEQQHDGANGNQDALLAAVAGAVILVVLSLAGPAHDWEHHAQQIIHLIDCTDLSIFTSSSLGRFLLMTAAHLDTPAGSLGRSTPSTSAWSRWGIDDLPRPADKLFSEFEIVSGQPSSLASLIAQVGHCAESRRTRAIADTPGNNDAGRGTAEWQYVKTLIDYWEPPTFPEGYPGHQRLVLLTAWRAIVKAAKLYHLRQFGFYSDLGLPINGISQQSYLAMVEDLAVGIRFLLDDFKANNTTIANAMGWPLAVLGSECGSSSTRHLQGDVVRMIQDTSKTFLMPHLHQLLSILHDLWDEQILCTSPEERGPLSLESIARKHGLSVSLL